MAGNAVLGARALVDHSPSSPSEGSLQRCGSSAFADSTGLPMFPDNDPNANPRGLAIRFHLADCVHTDIIAQSTDGLPIRTGQEFLEFLRAAAASDPSSPSPSPIEISLVHIRPPSHSCRRPSPVLPASPRRHISALQRYVSSITLGSPDTAATAFRRNRASNIQVRRRPKARTPTTCSRSLHIAWQPGLSDFKSLSRSPTSATSWMTPRSTGLKNGP